MSAVTTIGTEPQIGLAALAAEAFPVAILRRLKFAGYAFLAPTDQAAVRRRAAACEIPPEREDRSARPVAGELAAIAPADAARNRAALEAELHRRGTSRRGARDV